MQSNQAPDGTLVAELLQERHNLDQRAILEVESSLDEESRAVLKLTLERPKTNYRPRETYSIQIGQNKPNPSWDSIVDALDALLGTLIETSYDYRNLPSGKDVEYQSEKFDVHVEYYRPDVEEAANRMLDGN